MRHPIDPKIDSVFKAPLGAESNRALLIPNMVASSYWS